MQIIDGKKVAEETRKKVAEEVKVLEKKPCLAVVLVGEDPASKIYVSKKHKMCAEVGIISLKHELPECTEEKDIINLIDELNEKDDVNGILIQLPLPKSIDKNKVLARVKPEKDVDGFHPLNAGKLMTGQECLKSCTPRGVMKLLDYYGIEPMGKDAVVIGKSIIVGTPMAEMLKNASATVSICHSKTKELKH